MTQDALSSGSAIGHYVITQILSRDTAGISYLGMDTTSVSGSSKVRIREVFPAHAVERVGQAVVAKSPEALAAGVETGRHIAATLARLDFPCLPRLRDSLELNGTHYLVLDEMEGEPLAAILLRQGSFPVSQLKSTLMILLPALEALHAAGLVHGRITLSGVLRLDDGYPALTGIETAVRSSDPIPDVRAIGKACESLLEAGGGDASVRTDKQLWMTLQGAAGHAGAPPVNDIATFRARALRTGASMPKLPLKMMAMGTAACLTLAGGAFAVQSGAFKMDLPKAKTKPDVVAKAPVMDAASLAAGLEAAALTASANEPVTGSAVQAAWLATDRNSAPALRAFAAEHAASEFAAIALERLAVMDERAWLAAESIGTPEAYAKYIDMFGAGVSPAGEHVAEAEAARKRLTKDKVAEIAETRKLLAGLGYTLDKSKGETPALSKAIRTFEAAQGQKLTGKVSLGLINQLKQAKQDGPTATATLVSASPATVIKPAVEPAKPVITSTASASAVAAPSPVIETAALPAARPQTAVAAPKPAKKLKAGLPKRVSKPAYPTASRKAAESGLTQLTVCVDARGRPTSANVVSSSGFARLDAAAVNWAMDMRGYAPALVDGEPVDGGCLSVPLEWKIED